jgi:CelD/BcsL family acetyltransferase involved in cellulose biosynthesis
VRTELIALGDLKDTEIASWRDLAARALEPNPFYEPEYALPLARELGQLDTTALLTVANEDGWTACLPVTRSRWHRIPLRSLASWHGHVLYGLLGTPLVAADGGAEALEELVDGILRKRRVSFAAFEEVSEDGAVGALLNGLLRDRPSALPIERFERAALRRRPELTYIEETLNSKRRRELRRQRRKLGEELGAEPVAVDRAGDDAAYEALVALEAAGRKSERGTVMAADERHSRFFVEMCRNFAALGRLQLLALEAGDETLALQCNLAGGDTIFRVKIAYDERWAAYSPGIQLELDVVADFHERRSAVLMDSCASPNNAMINRLWPDRRAVATWALPATGPRGWLAGRTLGLAKSLREFNRRRSE